MNVIAWARSFVAVVETGSLTRAAQREGLSLSAVSRQLTGLEEHVGRTLLYRSRSGARPTPEGRRFLPRARALVAAADDALGVFDDGQHVEGVMRVSATVTWGLSRLIPRLGVLRERAPGLSVELVLEDRPVEDMVASGVDVAIRANIPLPDSVNYHARRLERVTPFWVASPGYLARSGALDAPGDLTGHDVLTSLASSGATAKLTRGPERVEVEVSGPLRVRTLLARRDAAIMGLGVTQLPSFLADPEIERGTLARVLPTWGAPGIDVFALYRAELAQDPRIRIFLEALSGA